MDDKKKEGGDPKEPKEPEKKPEDYTEEDIKNLQDELANADPEKDADKIKEKEAFRRE